MIGNASIDSGIKHIFAVHFKSNVPIFSQVTGGPNNMASTLKAARAALMLIPILGIHFLMMPIR